jgi:hypothetical protein
MYTRYEIMIMRRRISRYNRIALTHTIAKFTKCIKLDAEARCPRITAM